ncbi:MAG: SAM-dependent methyltransferase [Desulfohalobiaceae bacterium]
MLHRIIYCAFALFCSLNVCLIANSQAAQQGQFYVIGVGPAGPQTATIQALERIKSVDVIIASEEHCELFKDYLGDKRSMFDPWSGFWDYKGKPYRKLTATEKKKLKSSRIQKRDQRVARIREVLEQGKDVGLLDSGNPCLFGPSHWYVEQFKPDEVTIIPGMGADAAAMAALGKSTIPAHDTRFVMQTAPFFLADREAEDWDIMQDLADYSYTKILYMALRDPENLFANLSRYLPLDMPCAVVFWAGYPEKQQVVHGNIGNMPEKLSDYNEDYMGLLLIGRFLEGKPYERAQQR